MNIFGWVILGALSGWIASMFTGNNAEMGAGRNIFIGIVGGLVGGFMFNLFGGIGITGFNLWSLIVATAGAILLLMIINLLRRNRTAA